MSQNDLAQRAKEHLPTVLLTMLSIVQALALELLWSYIQEHDYLYGLTAQAALSWLQISATLLGILLIWLIYSSLVMRFRWVPTTLDSAFPFIVGLVEFSQIACLKPEHLGWWFIILAVIFGLMTWIGQMTMRRARLDGDNDSFFRSRSPAAMADFIPAFMTIGILVSLGLVFSFSSHRGWFAYSAVLTALGFLGFQLWRSDYFWRQSIATAELATSTFTKDGDPIDPSL